MNFQLILIIFNFLHIFHDKSKHEKNYFPTYFLQKKKNR